MSQLPFLSCQGLIRSYRLGKKKIEILKGVDLEISRGEKVFLCGASGAGKTTLMYSLAGLEKPDKGKVIIEGEDLYEYSRGKQAELRNKKLGYVFQNYFLLPELTALENVMIPGMIAGKEVETRARALLEQVGLADRMGHLPAELSGGEQQRVAIARSLINQPLILFADEPTGNLDSKNGDLILDLLFEMTSSSNTTLVVVTHDSQLAARGDRIVSIVDGIIEAGPEGKRAES